MTILKFLLPVIVPAISSGQCHNNFLIRMLRTYHIPIDPDTTHCQFFMPIRVFKRTVSSPFLF